MPVLKEEAVAEATPEINRCVELAASVRSKVILFGWDSAKIEEQFPKSPMDKTIIQSHDAENLQSIADLLVKYQSNACKVQIQGSACKLGTKDHDLKLADERAQAVFDRLLEMLPAEAK